MEIAVDLVSELADKLRSDAKRLAEDKEKILRSIESLVDLLKSDRSTTLSEGNKCNTHVILKMCFFLFMLFHQLPIYIDVIIGYFSSKR